MDPNLYIKIILLGLDQLLKRFSLMGTDVDAFLAARISQIPRLLKEARNNLREVPRVYSEVAIETLDCSISYLMSAGKLPRNRALSRAINSLSDFRKFLIRKSCSTQFIEGRGLLKKILKDSFSCRMSPEEIFEIGSESYRSTLRKLKRVSGTINAGKTWKGILSSYSVRPKGRNGLIGLYSGEIKNLLEFFENKKIIGISQGQRIVVSHTPYFMRPIRASASYSSPVTNDRKEPAYFYVTPHNDLHNEYKFVTAHETYPGHHLLDTIRRQNINPVRRQIESPLFYEGWASYAESLIDQFGYIKDKRQKLLCLRRQAWRAVRAMLDVG